MANEIIKRNLEKLISRNEGDMLYLGMGNPESMGGNAESWNDLPCFGANFFYEHQSGELLYFTNDPLWYLPDKIKRDWKEPMEGSFRIAFDLRCDLSDKANPLKGSFKYRIIGMTIHPNVPNEAKHNLEETVRVYNEQHGFSIE
jgi:hypothetical protein